MRKQSFSKILNISQQCVRACGTQVSSSISILLELWEMEDITYISEEKTSMS